MLFRSEASVGVSIDAGGDLRLAHEIGAGNAKLLALTGRRVDATAAARLGFVQEVVPRDDLDATAMGLAREIAANAPLAVQGIKRTINMFAERGMSEAMCFCTAKPACVRPRCAVCGASP